MTADGLLRLATAQRSLGGGLLFLLGVVVGGVILALQAAGLPTLVQNLPAAVAGLFVAACVFEHARAMGRSRGLQWTLALGSALVPLGLLIVPGASLVLGRRRLREHAVKAGLFWVRRSELDRLAAPADSVCAVCGYDRTGLTPHTVCPECGNLVPPRVTL